MLHYLALCVAVYLCFVVGENECSRGNNLSVVHAHDAHACCRATLAGDFFHWGANCGSTRSHHHDVIVDARHKGSHYVTLFAGELDANHAHAASTLAGKVADLGALAIARLGDDENCRIILGNVARHHFVGCTLLHSADTCGRTAHWANTFFGEANGLTIARHHEDVVAA